MVGHSTQRLQPIPGGDILVIPQPSARRLPWQIHRISLQCHHRCPHPERLLARQLRGIAHPLLSHIPRRGPRFSREFLSLPCCPSPLRHSGSQVGREDKPVGAGEFSVWYDDVLPRQWRLWIQPNRDQLSVIPLLDSIRILDSLEHLLLHLGHLRGSPDNVLPSLVRETNRCAALGSDCKQSSTLISESHSRRSSKSFRISSSVCPRARRLALPVRRSPLLCHQREVSWLSTAASSHAMASYPPSPHRTLCLAVQLV